MSMTPESDSLNADANDALLRSVEQPIPPTVDVSTTSDHLEVRLSGDWQMHGVAEIDGDVRKIGADLKNGQVVVYFENVGRLDTSGALLVERMRDRLELADCTVSYSGTTADQDTLLEAIGNAFACRTRGRGSRT